MNASPQADSTPPFDLVKYNFDRPPLTIEDCVKHGYYYSDTDLYHLQAQLGYDGDLESAADADEEVDVDANANLPVALDGGYGWVVKTFFGYLFFVMSLS